MDGQTLLYLAIGAVLLAIVVKVVRYGPKRCPKCRSIVLFGAHTMANTSDRERVYCCYKCKHEWLVDHSDKLFG